MSRFFGRLFFLLLLLSISFFFTYCSPVEYDFPLFEWQQEQTYEWAELPVVKTDKVGFKSLSASKTGINFSNEISDDLIAENRNLLNGSGVAAGDVTGNGYPDLYFSRIEGPNVLYENLGGFRFRDITEKAGVALPDQFSTGVLFADLNGNDLLDLVVTAIGSPNRIFFNNGDTTFTEREDALSAEDTYGSTSIAAGDLTGNGAIDLYIVNYKKRSVRDIYPYENEFKHIVRQKGDEFVLQPKFEGHYKLDWRDQFLLWFEIGEPDLLYLNDGSGNFEKVDLTDNIFFDEDGDPITEPLPDWGLHAKIYDINQNGLQDIYVANDFESPDRIWLNQGDGTFRALSRLAKRKSSLSSMAVDFSDINRNGLTDFLVIEMLSRSHKLRHKQMSTMAPSAQSPGAIDNRPQYLGNTLFLNRGDTTWAEISEYSGVRRSDWSWSAEFLDVNLNGYEDVLVSTGHYLDVQDSDSNFRIRTAINNGTMDMERLMLYYANLPNQNAIFRNDGDLKFSDMSSEWGFTDKDISHGMAIVDLNNSGYRDVVMNRLGDEATVYQNLVDKPRVMIRLKGTPPNTRAGGAKVYFEGGPVSQSKSVTISGGYLSSSDDPITFAAQNHSDHTIRVVWPDSTESIIENVKSNRIYKIPQKHASDIKETPGEKETISAWFKDVSPNLNHDHEYVEYDDFDRQPLLYRRVDRSGPSFSLVDLNGNGSDDLIASGSSNVLPEVFINTGESEFQKKDISGLDVEPGDQSGVLAWKDVDNKLHMIVGYSGYTPEETDRPAARYFIVEDGVADLRQEFKTFESSVGGMSLADYSGNGYPDLFIAGSVNPGRYPEPATSRLYLNDGNQFQPDEENNPIFKEIGLITGQTFSDITGDGKPELILAERWGSIRVFKVENGTFKEVTGELGFDSFKGWWNGVATGDLTGNGLLDIVAVNWGENHPYMYRGDGEPMIFYEDMNRDGYVDIIEAYYDREVGGIVPRRGFQHLAQNPPFIGRNVQSYQQYSESTLEAILGHSLDRYQSVSANYFKHTAFIQQEDGSFETVPLPAEAQLSPAFAPVIADFNGNGMMDLFLSQNYFSYRDELPRSDAGRGLLLEGDGTGSFKALPGHESGILVYGEQRGAVAGDMNRNGRADLIVGQFANQTRVFTNQEAKPALRVRLMGFKENPAAIGARINLKYEDGSRGAVREVTAGAGYRSQNSFVKLLSNFSGAKWVEVRWPDGRESEVKIEDAQHEMIIRYDEVVL